MTKVGMKEAKVAFLNILEMYGKDEHKNFMKYDEAPDDHIWYDLENLSDHFGIDPYEVIDVPEEDEDEDEEDEEED